MGKRVLTVCLLALSLNAMLAQTVDYSVVLVGEESGINLTKVTSDNDCVCMPEVRRWSDGIDWLSNRIIDVSSDGAKLAYLSMRGNVTNIFVKDISRMGSSVQRTNRQNVLDFSYSPDGKSICFTELTGEGTRLFVTDAVKGYVCRQITTNDADYTPVYAGDMSCIYFSRQEEQGFGVWSYNLKDNLLSSIAKGMNPSPANGGEAVFCVRQNSGGKNEIWKINYMAGTEECVVSDLRRSFTTPSVSPDGKWLLFVGSTTLKAGRYNYENTDIYVCRVDGTGFTQLTYHAADDLSPVWSRDGKHIYFISQRGSANGTANVWRMNFIYQ